MGKCNSCKYGRTAFEKGMSSIKGMSFLNSNPKSTLGDMYGICDNGHQDTFVKWWKSGIGIPSSETKDVECYEPTEFDRRSNELIGVMDDLLEAIKEGKK